MNLLVRNSLWLLVIIAMGMCGYFLLSYKSPHWEVSAIAFSPDGKTLIVGTYRWHREPSKSTPRYLVGGIIQSVKSLDPTTGKELEEVERTPSDLVRIALSPEPCSWIQFSTDGKKLAIGQWDGTTVLKETASWKNITTLEGPQFVRNVAFSPEGNSLCVGYRSWAMMWNPSDPASGQDFDFYTDRPRATSFSPDGTLLALSGRSVVSIVDAKRLSLLRQFQWDATNGELVENGDTELMRCGNVAFTPKGDSLAVACIAGDETESVVLIDAKTGKTTHRIQGRYGVIRFSPDGQTMAIGGYDGLSLINREDMQERFFEHRKGILDLTFSPDSTKILFGDSYGNVECRNSEDGTVLWTTSLDGF